MCVHIVRVFLFFLRLVVYTLRRSHERVGHCLLSALGSVRLPIVGVCRVSVRGREACNCLKLCGRQQRDSIVVSFMRMSLDWKRPPLWMCAEVEKPVGALLTHSFVSSETAFEWNAYEWRVERLPGQVQVKFKPLATGTQCAESGFHVNNVKTERNTQSNKKKKEQDGSEATLNNIIICLCFLVQCCARVHWKRVHVMNLIGRIANPFATKRLHLPQFSRVVIDR